MYQSVHSFFSMNIFNFTTICPFVFFIICKCLISSFFFYLLKGNQKKREQNINVKNFVLKVLVYPRIEFNFVKELSTKYLSTIPLPHTQQTKVASSNN